MKYIFLPCLSRLEAHNCGIALLKPGWLHPSRTLKTSVLILGKKGHVEIREENETLHVAQNTFVLLSAGRHHEGVKAIEESASYFWMHFKTAEQPVILNAQRVLSILSTPVLLKEILQNGLLLPQNITLKDTKSFLDIFHDLLYIQERPSFIQSKMQVLFRLMLINLSETVLSEKIDDIYDPTRDSIVYTIIQKVHENFTDTNFSVKMLSELVHYNADYLGRIFKNRMGRSIGDYITDQRIKYAVTLLVESNMTVEAIAYECGFYSCRNFIRQFKARKRETPTELRRRYRATHVTNR